MLIAALGDFNEFWYFSHNYFFREQLHLAKKLIHDNKIDWSLNPKASNSLFLIGGVDISFVKVFGSDLNFNVDAYE